MRTFNSLSNTSTSQQSLSIASLLLRFTVGATMLAHGIPKIMSFTALSTTFPDPIGLGSTLSLILAIGAEVGCSLLLIFGLLTRLASLPLIFNMAVIFFIVHHSAPFAAKELALFYLVLYIAIFILGGGQYSLDRLFFKK